MAAAEVQVDKGPAGEADPDQVRVEVIRAWPRGFEQVPLRLPAGATVATALAASGFPAAEVSGYAVFGTRARPETVLRDGDRVELLRPLLVDPKDARRQRARK